MALSQKKSYERLSIKEKFKYFNEILDLNDKAHYSMNFLSGAIASGEPFSSQLAISKLNDLFTSLEKMTHLLSKLASKDYTKINEIVRQLKIDTRLALIPKIKCPENLKCQDLTCEECKKLEQLYNDTPYYYDLSEVDCSKQIEVGNKMARLGEIKNRLKLPVPDGFCLTIKLFDDILSHNNLRTKKNNLIRNINFFNTNNIQYISNQIQALIISTELPPYLENIIYEAYRRVFQTKDVMLAVRSSAFGEDSESHSFAGLHRSILNVSKEYLIDSVLKVLVSFYSPQSVIYRYLSGIRDEDMPMSAGCIEMVKAKSAGVLFTKNPNSCIDGMLIQAVWGLGNQVVDGTVKPQEFIVKEVDNNYEIDFNGKSFYINTKDFDKTIEDACLQAREIIKLYQYSKEIEKHFEGPQDIEWAIENNGKIFILQARPLLVRSLEKISIAEDFSIEKYDKINPPIISNGDCASSGIAYGKAFIINSLRDIGKVNEGSVVVAKKNFIELTAILHKISALITDIGSTTGHLSIIARELKVPVITNTINATEIIKDGDEITIIADEKRVYRGYNEQFAEIIKKQREEGNVFRNSPVYKIWSELINSFFTLNLIDASSDNFKAENCKTLHDIIRYIHEISMRSMFVFYSDTNLKVEKSYKLKSQLPLDIYIIDLGEHETEKESKFITIDEITYLPFRSLFEGMTSPGIMWSGYIGVDTKGFAEMVMQSASSSNLSDLTDNTKSYAFISENYLNFFSQLGFHFSRLDTYVSDNINQNYINFNFRGGATTDIRKSRRAKAISKILENLGFTSIVRVDDVSAKLTHIKKTEALESIKMLGRLMGFIRNADVLMLREEHIDLFVQSFLSGDAYPKFD